MGEIELQIGVDNDLTRCSAFLFPISAARFALNPDPKGSVHYDLIRSPEEEEGLYSLLREAQIPEEIITALEASLLWRKSLPRCSVNNIYCSMYLEQDSCVMYWMRITL